MYVKVRILPGQKKEEVEELGENRLKIKVKEKAEQNQANARVRQILAKIYKVAEGKVRIVSGHRSPSKIFSIND